VEFSASYGNFCFFAVIAAAIEEYYANSPVSEEKEQKKSAKNLKKTSNFPILTPDNTQPIHSSGKNIFYSVQQPIYLLTVWSITRKIYKHFAAT